MSSGTVPGSLVTPQALFWPDVVIFFHAAHEKYFHEEYSFLTLAPLFNLTPMPITFVQ